MVTSTQKCTRTSAPKVRTGCRTCKRRHLKCDEKKPFCRRCVKNGCGCEGYELNPISKQRAQKRALLKDSAEPVGLSLLKSCRTVHPGGSLTNQELELLHQFESFLIEEAAPSHSSTDFWVAHVMPLSYTVEPVKHAVFALGSSHRFFQFQQLSKSGVETAHSVTKLYRDSISHYNQAIRSIRKFMQASSTENTELVLVCCVIFICIENLQSRYHECQRHAKAASSIVRNIRQTATEPRPKPHGLMRGIENMLLRVSDNFLLYTGDDLNTDFGSLMPLSSQIDDQTSAFPSLWAAKESLYLLTKQFDSTFSSNQSLPKQHDVARMMDLQPQFLTWIKRFEMFTQRFDEATSSKPELYMFRSLSLNHALWEGFWGSTKSSSGCTYRREQSEEILRQAELLLCDFPKSTPTFTFEGNTIFALVVVVSATSEADIQERSVKLLRSMRLRQGVWDSEQVADLVEAAIYASKDNRCDLKNLVGGIPELARTLSCLNLPQLDIPRDILLL